MQHEFDLGRARLAKLKMDAGAFLTQGELQSLLGLSASTIDRLPLPTYRIGKSKRYLPDDINRLVASGRELIAA